MSKNFPRKKVLCYCVLALILMCTACDRSENSGDNFYVKIYCTGENSSTIETEVREYSEGGSTTEDYLMFTLEQLSAVPKDDGFKSAIPDDYDLLTVELVNDVAVITFEAEPQQKAGIRKKIADACIVLSMTQFQGVNSVQYQFEQTGNSLTLSPSDFVIDSPALVSSLHSFRLYFKNKVTGELSSENRVVYLRENESPIWYSALMEALLIGPTSGDFQSEIPVGTKLLSVAYENGVCTVNLSQEFLTCESVSAAESALSSIVYTLTEMKNIKLVRFLIDGTEHGNYFSFDLMQPISRENFSKT